MKKLTLLVLAALLALSALNIPAIAEDLGLLGRLTKLNVDEAMLTDAISEG